jgi:uncharacterized FlgJ-related protein
LRHNKKINHKRINFYKIGKFLFIRVKPLGFILLVLVLFVFAYKMTYRVFSNDYVINNFFKGVGYSQTCLTLSNDDMLPKKLYDFFATTHDYKKNITIAPIFFHNMPEKLDRVENLEVKKRLFTNILLPILVKVENETLSDRKKILAIAQKLIEVPLNDNDFSFIEEMADKYKVIISERNFWNYSMALEELINRVDIVPTSLTLAIAAKETGWGTSRFLLEGNSLFSQYVWSDNMSMLPRGREPGLTHRIRKFNTLEEAVRAYFFNINTHKAYSEFRGSRARMRSEDNSLDPILLAYRLENYSVENMDYIKDLISIIRTNNLLQYDSLKAFNRSYSSSICVNII